MKSWFNVDKEGLARLLARRGKAWAMTEVIQNAWDQNVTMVKVRLEKLPNERLYTLSVEDDDPRGFTDLAHAFTLFADSAKKSDVHKRGRFNVGEKLVLALCSSATLVSTTGALRFDEKGRHTLRDRRTVGSLFEGKLQLSREEFDECCSVVRTLIPPPGVLTTFNGEALQDRMPIAEIPVTLPTDVADEEGRLVRRQRQTTLRLYEVLPNERAGLYELGIPVCPTDDKWHVDVQQKVPLNMERDNVPPAYLRAVRVAVLNAMAAQLARDDATQPWVRDAVADKRVEGPAVRTVTTLRFGDRCVANDLSDVEGTKRAMAAGYTVVYSGHLSADEWANVRRANAIPPAGQVTPSPRPFQDGGLRSPLRVRSSE